MTKSTSAFASTARLIYRRFDITAKYDTRYISYIACLNNLISVYEFFEPLEVNVMKILREIVIVSPNDVLTRHYFPPPQNFLICAMKLLAISNSFLILI